MTNLFRSGRFAMSYPVAVPDVIFIDPRIHRDDRGSFTETYRENEFASILGGDAAMVQTNISSSYKDVLRGLHTQTWEPQGKLVTCVAGAIQDVAVDVRFGSPTYGQHASKILTASHGEMMWCPPGFLHGFLALENSVVCYQCSTLYYEEYACSVRWNDPALGIEWMIDNPILSAKDAAAPLLKDSVL